MRQEVRVQTFVAEGDQAFQDINSLSEEEKRSWGMRLQEKALRAIGIEAKNLEDAHKRNNGEHK